MGIKTRRQSKDETESVEIVQDSVTKDSKKDKTEKSLKKAKKEKKAKKDKEKHSNRDSSSSSSKKRKNSEPSEESKPSTKKVKKDTAVVVEAPPEGSNSIKNGKEDTIVVADQHIDEYRQSNATKQDENDIPDNLRLESLGLSQSTLDSLRSRGITRFFPIQAASYSPIMEGKDLLARARTGTGKTLAFSLPMVESLKRQKKEDPSAFSKRGRSPRVLIMAPTRELAIQVQKEMDQICSNELVTTCVYGGTSYDPQYIAMKQGLDLIVGTPGRLIDHIERGNLKLESLRFICMDEADQMLDIGFAEDMEKILNLVKDQKSNNTKSVDHQVLLFSATMPDWIKQAVQKYMKNDKITLDLIGSNKQKTSATVKHYCLPSRYQNRTDILGDIVAVYGRGNSGRTIIFVETKAEASELAMNEKLVAMGGQALHGDIAQKQRETTMQGFRDGKFTCLITTNVCARGVDIPEVDLVINCEPPSDVESYIHRSGRTGRAGKHGICITFYKQDQEYLVQNISKRAGVDFIKIGAPQPSDIVGARAYQNIEELKNVDPIVFSYFTESAKELLKHFKGDAQKSLECAMAMICNTTKPLPARSLLTANDGFVTLLFKTDKSIRNVGYVKTIIQKQYPALTYEDTIGWRLTADYQGVVVDVNEQKVVVNGEEVQLAGVIWKDSRGVSMTIPRELPELQANYGSDRFGGGSQRGGFRGGSRGNFGSRGRGGFSSRGGGGGGYNYGSRGGSSRGVSRGRGRGGY